MVNTLVNRTSKVLKNKEVKNAGWIIGGRIVQMILSFVVSIYTTRFLGPGNYGIINYALAYVTFFTSLCTLGIGSVIIKVFADNLDEQGETIGTTLVLRAVASFLSSIMIIGIVFLVDRDETITILVTALSSIALIFQVADTFNYWFQSKYQSKISSIATLIAYILVSSYKIILLVCNMSVVWFALANSIDYICMAIVLLYVYKKYNGPKLRFSTSKAKELLGQSYHYILSGMMIAIYSQTDKFMLKHMLDERSVGYYSLASSINTMWVFLLAAIIDSMYPTIISLYKTNKDGFIKKNKQLYAIITYVSIFVALMFTIFGETLICLVYGEAYAPASVPLKIVTWYVIFSYLSVARNVWVVCERKQKYLKYMYFIAAISNVFMNLLLIPLWGASGAATASLITQILTTVILPLFIPDMRENAKIMIESFIFKGVF